MQTDWSKINSYYQRGLEQNRLAAASNLERLRTLDILDRFLEAKPLVINDVGGGAGVYAGPLAQKGHEVHLIDPVELHIQQGRALNQTLTQKIASIEIGNALALSIKDETADVVLMFGPLYHLIDREQRLKALAEAKRVLKAGGLLFAVGISRFAPLMDLFWNKECSLENPIFYQMVEQDLRDGQHRCPEGTNCFTTAYLHHPYELRDEVLETGFQDPHILGIEGPVWNTPDRTKSTEQDIRFEHRLKLLQILEEEPSLIGASAHLMIIAKKF